MSTGNFFTGRPGQWEQRSTLRPDQESLFNQYQNAIQGKGAGGAFGQIADYYRDLYDPSGQAFQQFAAPEMRRFREETIPGLSEQFAGMGSGGLSSSSFRNAAVNAGTDLSERLGMIRAQLRQQGAQGLQNFARGGLDQFSENIYNAGQPGLIDTLAPLVGGAIGSFGGPVLGALGTAAGQAATNWFSNKNKANTKQIYGGGKF